MYHSITIGDKNTWDDWHLIPSSRPVFNPPAVKTRYLDVPGANGSLDLTGSLTGYPVYQNREGSFEFYVDNEHAPWHEIYSSVMSYLHGQKMNAILEDDPEYYYQGRFSVDSWKSQKDNSMITINYNVSPYKWAVKSSIEPWLWDPFSFVSGVITSGIFSGITVSSGGTPLTFDTKEVGDAPISVGFVAGSNAGVRLTISGKDDVNIAAGSSQKVPGLIMYRGTWLYGGRPAEVIAYPSQGSSSATLSMDFRRGRF